MRKYVYEEYIRYDALFEQGRSDLFGEHSPLTEDGKREFLAKYLAYGKRRYGDDFLFRKAAKRDEVQKALEVCSVGAEKKEKFSAYIRDAAHAYKHVRLYTDRATIIGDRLVFRENYTFPVPCAKCELGDNTLGELNIGVKISKAYRRPLNEGILLTTAGRTVEFRKGCKPLLRLFFAANGKLYVKEGEENMPSYKLTELCDYPFDDGIEIRVTFGDRSASVFVHDTAYDFPLADGAPDTVFFCGGFQPVDAWEVAVHACVTSSGEHIDISEKNADSDAAETYIGDVTLPYAIGTAKYKDKELVLRKTFFADEDFLHTGKVYSLYVHSLDPGGEVAINGKAVARKDDFDPLEKNITEFVRAGENELELTVFPRAPELPYAWHKHDDCYNGWLCGGAEIRESYVCACGKPKITTLAIGNGEAEFSVEWDTGIRSETAYEIRMAESFPKASGETFLCAGECADGKIRETLRCSVEIWTLENPTLYTVRVRLIGSGKTLCEKKAETGFRTVCQSGGDILLNGEKIVLKGALNMQFLPPYEEIPVNHVCPSDYALCEQIAALKNMNGNCLRMHRLGYGDTDDRIASYCDRLGVLLIWTTRLIDGVENVQWTRTWRGADVYARQMETVYNHPSIVMWEGSNELHASSLEVVDEVYDAFVRAAERVDTHRLLCPVSHLYYGGGIYEMGCKYYSDDGTADENGNAAKASFGWTAPGVVRSAHTYSLLLGYGSPWHDMRTQNWREQAALAASRERAYIVSEYAVIGRQNPETEEAKQFLNEASYELGDECNSLGFCLSDDEWEMGQAYQALCAAVATKRLLCLGADGMLWCCLWGGANNASYLKPVVDFYGYRKHAYYALAEAFQPSAAFNKNPDVLLYAGYRIEPYVTGLTRGKRYRLRIAALDEEGNEAASIRYDDFTADAFSKDDLAAWTPHFGKDGYYVIRYELTEL